MRSGVHDVLPLIDQREIEVDGDSPSPERMGCPLCFVGRDDRSEAAAGDRSKACSGATAFDLECISDRSISVRFCR